MNVGDILAAADRIRPHVHRTPVVTCSMIDRIAGCSIVFKCENLQKVGAFKARGATNAVLLLDHVAAARGVATHSSGNHAAALARAASLRGIPSFIVMPRTAPAPKRAAVEAYGARITPCEPTLAARESTLAEVVARTGATFVHPYDDERVIAGQGTAALELLAQSSGLDVVVAPVGGGGLLSGTAVATAAVDPAVEVLGAEPAGADDAFRSLRDGVLTPSVAPCTVADGLLTSLSERTFGLIKAHSAGILTASEETIVRAMRLIWERAKLVVEPSAAVPLAVVLDHPDRFARRRVGLILSGGNIDLDRLPWTAQAS